MMQAIHAVGLRVSISLYMYLCCILQFSAHPTSYSALLRAPSHPSWWQASPCPCQASASQGRPCMVPKPVTPSTSESQALRRCAIPSKSLKEAFRLINVHGCRCYTSVQVRRPKKDSLCRAGPLVARGGRGSSLSDSRGTTWCRQIQRRIRFRLCSCSSYDLGTYCRVHSTESKQGGI